MGVLVLVQVMILNSRREAREKQAGAVGEDTEDHVNTAQVSQAGDSRKRKNTLSSENVASASGHSEDEDETEVRSVKKSRIERKKEFALKRKEKENRRKENKRKRALEEEGVQGGGAAVDTVSEVSGSGSSSMKRKKVRVEKKEEKKGGQKKGGEKKSSTVASEGDSTSVKGTWGGFKRYRAAKKAGGRK